MLAAKGVALGVMTHMEFEEKEVVLRRVISWYFILTE